MPPEEPRFINGVPLPPRPTKIDEEGYETTKHSLRFRGEDWNIVLNNKRDALTSLFVKEAGVATGIDDENIQNVRFSIDNQGRMNVKFTVRHKVQMVQSIVQERLAEYPFKMITGLYEPQTKRPRPKSRTKKYPKTVHPTGRHVRLNLSFFGHDASCMGPNGPEFRDEKEEEENLMVPETEQVYTRSGITLVA